MKKVLLWILGIALAGIVIIGGVAAYKIHNTTSKIYSNNEQISKTSDQKTSAKKPVAYLLLGTDTGALGRDYKGRTDTMMVMIINPSTKSSTMLSLQRDTLISLNGQNAKLNAAYAYGSADSAMAEVEQLLDIKLDGYLLVNMKGMKQLVNAVGGVTVTSPLTFNYEGYSFVEGQSYHVDGTEALAFSRMRYDDPRGDYGRQERQQLVIKSVMDKLQANPTTVMSDKFLGAVADNVRTDVSLTSLKNLAQNYREAGTNIKSDQMVGTGTMIDGVSYQIMDNSEISRVHNVIENALKTK